MSESERDDNLAADAADAAAAPLLVVDRLHKSYPTVLAVNDLTFVVRPGDILGLVGPNGAGKTTTMRAIAGIIPPTRGTIHVCGHDIQQDAINAKRAQAYVPDDPQLFDALTVWEHLEFIASVYEVPAFEERATQLLERFELMPKRDTMGQELSRGMRQKLAICCAYLHDPKLLMLDEPMTGLDPRGIRTMKQSLHEQAAQDAGIIISSHLLSLVEDLCTHLLVLDQGERRFFGSLQDARETIADVDEGSSLEDVFFRITEGDAENFSADSQGEPQREATDERG